MSPRRPAGGNASPPSSRPPLSLWYDATSRPAAALGGGSQRPVRDDHCSTKRLTPANLEGQLRRFCGLVARDVAKGAAQAISAGSLHLLGFAEVREHVGDQWPEIEAAARQLTEMVIERHLGRDDLYFRMDANPDGQGAEGYGILFAHGGSAHAASVSRRIAAAVNRALVGRWPFAPTLTIDAIPLTLRGTDLLRSVRDLGAIVRTVRSAEVAAEAAERDECLSIAVELAYFLLLARRKRLTSLHLLSAASLAPGTARFAAEVDAIVLDLLVAALAGGPRCGHRALFLAPVRFATLSVREFREPYLARLAALPAFVRRRVLLCIREFEPTAPQSRLFDVSHRVAAAGGCRGLLISLPLGFTDHQRYRYGGLTGVVAELPDDGLAEALVGQMRAFARNARLAGLRSVAIASTPLVAGLALRQPFDYVGGAGLVGRLSGGWGRVFALRRRPSGGAR